MIRRSNASRGRNGCAEEHRDPRRPWRRQHAAIEIDDKLDAITADGVEVWNLLTQAGIEAGALLCGVHRTCCVLGRPFGLRHLASNGKQPLLIRDLTDTMYNPASKPYVQHHSGTTLIVDYIERHICGTIDSAHWFSGTPFRFADDRRNVVMMIGEDEYKTEVTLSAFAASTLAPLGYCTKFVHASKENPNNFPGIVEALVDADLALDQRPTSHAARARFAAVRQHWEAGKPMIGIRTASHAFAVRDPAKFKPDAENAVWQDFDPEVWGGHYTNHHKIGPTTRITIAPDAAASPLLAGVDFKDFTTAGTLYKTSPLQPGAMVVLTGELPDAGKEPVAWTYSKNDTVESAFTRHSGIPLISNATISASSC